MYYVVHRLEVDKKVMRWDLACTVLEGFPYCEDLV